MTADTLPSLADFTIEVCYTPHRRKHKYYAEVRVRDTGKRLFNTPFVATPNIARHTAGRMLEEAIAKHHGWIVSHE